MFKNIKKREKTRQKSIENGLCKALSRKNMQLWLNELQEKAKKYLVSSKKLRIFATAFREKMIC